MTEIVEVETIESDMSDGRVPSLVERGAAERLAVDACEDERIGLRLDPGVEMRGQPREQDLGGWRRYAAQRRSLVGPGNDLLPQAPGLGRSPSQFPAQDRGRVESVRAIRPVASP